MGGVCGGGRRGRGGRSSARGDVCSARARARNVHLSDAQQVLRAGLKILLVLSLLTFVFLCTFMSTCHVQKLGAMGELG